MQEIDRAVDGIEQPQQLMAARITALLLTQEANLWRLVMQEVADEALDSHIDFRCGVSITFLGKFAWRVGADYLGGFSSRTARDAEIVPLVLFADHRTLTLRPGEIGFQRQAPGPQAPPPGPL